MSSTNVFEINNNSKDAASERPYDDIGRRAINSIQSNSIQFIWIAAPNLSHAAASVCLRAPGPSRSGRSLGRDGPATNGLELIKFDGATGLLNLGVTIY